MLDVFNLNGQSLGIENRKGFYEAIRREFDITGRITKKVKTVRLLLMTSRGDVYIQKRSKLKSENAGLYDKTVGGHVTSGTSFELTVVKEGVEELGLPGVVLPKSQFNQAVGSIDLRTIGLFKRIDHLKDFTSIRTVRGQEPFVQPLISRMFVGYFDGAIRFADGESSGLEVVSPADLLSEIEANPEKFTQDLVFMVTKYFRFLVPARL